MSHTITLTQVPTDDDDSLDWDTAGTCDRSCLLWGPGPGGPTSDPDSPDAPGEQVVGGVLWRGIDGQWMRQTANCALAECAGDLEESLLNSVTDIRVGDVFDVEPDYCGDGDWQFFLTPARG